MNNEADAGGRAARSALLELIARWSRRSDIADLTRPSSDALVQEARTLDDCAGELEAVLEAAGLAAGDRPSLDPRAERVFEAVVHTYEGDDYMVPEDLREASFVKRARRFREGAVGARSAPQEPEYPSLPPCPLPAQWRAESHVAGREANQSLMRAGKGIAAAGEIHASQLDGWLASVAGDRPPLPDRDLLPYGRLLELMDEFGITETDALKHRLEDHDRWRARCLNGELVGGDRPAPPAPNLAPLIEAHRALAEVEAKVEQGYVDGVRDDDVDRAVTVVLDAGRALMRQVAVGDRPAPPAPNVDEVEAYIRAIPWSGLASDFERAQVAANIRSFGMWLRGEIADGLNRRRAGPVAAPAPPPPIGWQPIATAPVEDIVLVHDDGYIGRAMLEKDGRWLDVECGDKYFDPAPTEWLPLPEPPVAAPVPQAPLHRVKELEAEVAAMQLTIKQWEDRSYHFEKLYNECMGSRDRPIDIE